MNVAQHLTDKEAAEKGRWFEFDGAHFRIAAHGNPAFQKALLKVGKKNRGEIQREDLVAINGMTLEVMSRTILLDWKGVKNGDQDFPYSPANALHLMTVAEGFRKWVEEQAMSASNFVKGEEAADEASLKSGRAVGAEVE